EQLQNPMNMSQNIINYGGQTADTQDIRSKLNTIFNGQTGYQSAAQSYADRVMNSWGFSPSMLNGLDAANGLIQNGGFNDYLRQNANVASDILGNRGFGPETQGALDFFSGIMGSGGRDAPLWSMIRQGQDMFMQGGFTNNMNRMFENLMRDVTGQ